MFYKYVHGNYVQMHIYIHTCMQTLLLGYLLSLTILANLLIYNSLYLFNTYCGYAPLLVQDGDKCLLSKEGVTFIYDVIIMQLLCFL